MLSSKTLQALFFPPFLPDWALSALSERVGRVKWPRLEGHSGDRRLLRRAALRKTRQKGLRRKKHTKNKRTKTEERAARKRCFDFLSESRFVFLSLTPFSPTSSFMDFKKIHTHTHSHSHTHTQTHTHNLSWSARCGLTPHPSRRWGFNRDL